MFAHGCSRQLKRLEAVTRAPIYQYYQDTFNGLESIRSFQAEQRLIKEFEHCSNINGTAFFLFWVRYGTPWLLATWRLPSNTLPRTLLGWLFTGCKPLLGRHSGFVCHSDCVGCGTDRGTHHW